MITWSQVRNQSDGGIFLDGAQPLKVPGADGLVNTVDDGAVDVIVLPGPDGVSGTADDEQVPLTGFTRRIEIIDVNAYLREVRITVTYPFGSAQRQYTLMTYISNFA